MCAGAWAGRAESLTAYQRGLVIAKHRWPRRLLFPIWAALNLYDPDVISPPLVNRQLNPFCGLFQIAEATPFLHTIEQCLLWVRCWPSALINVPSVNAKPAHYSPRILQRVIGGPGGCLVIR